MKIASPSVEYYYLQHGFLVAGIDEAGRGCLAGPVVAGVVLLSKNFRFISNVRDSKLLSAKQREELFFKIKDNFTWSVGLATNDEVDKLGIRQATKLAMIRAYYKLPIRPSIILVDGGKSVNKFFINNTYYFAKGDQRFYSIAAASIVAKVYRDKLMNNYHKIFPEYGFDHNKGYGTKNHLDALIKLGPSPIHRRSFKRVIVD